MKLKRFSSQNQINKDMKRLVKQLSQVSEIDTRDIRQNIQKSSGIINIKRIKYQVENDKLLKRNNEKNLPGLLFSHRLYENKSKKVQSFNQKKIQSTAYLKVANYEMKKIQKMREKVILKQKKQGKRYKSQILPIKTSVSQLDKIHTNNDTWRQSLALSPQKGEQVSDRIKTAVHSSRKQLNKLFDTIKSKQPSILRRSLQQRLNQKTIQEQPKSHQQQTPEVQISSKKTLLQLIRLSSARSNNPQQPISAKLTRQQEIQIKATEALITNMKQQIQNYNKLKESIAFGGLKKLLYGDRKGKFIQDNTFRTRLKGQYSDQYMKIVKQQQQILDSFQGSFINRRNLMEKFSNILGQLRKQQKSPFSKLHVIQQSDKRSKKKSLKRIQEQIAVFEKFAQQ